LKSTKQKTKAASDKSLARSQRRKQERIAAKQKNSARHDARIAEPLLPGTWQTNTAAFVALTIASVVLYVGILRVDFLGLDDPQYVVNNPWIRSFSLQNLQHIFTTPYFANYSPFHLLSYMLDYAFAGASPFVFHFSSNIWGGLVAGFVFLVALALTGNRIVSVAASLLFIVHPAHVEAIAWVASRKDLVAVAFALPSFLTYLRYRQGGANAHWWYIFSLALFLFAVAGKLSVATFPAVFLAHDLFMEKRPLARSLLDKVPFVVAAAVFALTVASAQPPTGHRPLPYAMLAAFAQSGWLLTGFGTYVIYRVPPNPNPGALLQIAGAAMLLAVFSAPLLLRRRWPMAAVLLYWILFAFIPSQGLAFEHPVTDRYLFFPSVAAVILIAWALIKASEPFGRRGLFAAIALVAIISIAWTRTTLAYLGEWRDPRSVWYGATHKSSDSDAYYNLGSHYQDMAGRLGKRQRGAPLPKGEAERLAAAVWAGNPRLPQLLSEWQQGQQGGPIEQEFKHHLRRLAYDAYEQRIRNKGILSLPNVYFRRGLILSDDGDRQGARKEFLAAADDAAKFPFAEWRNEMLVRSHNALGVLAWQEQDFSEAMRWLKLADEEQIRAGGNWVPDLTANRKRLEGIIASPQTR
jgi:protein O-mannosyl-transferase